MTNAKMIEIAEIPPFRIHSSLFRTVYVVPEPPYVVSRKIDSLDLMVAEGVIGICVKMNNSITRIDSDYNPTIRELINTVRRMSMTTHKAHSRISAFDGGRPSPVTSLVCMKVEWDEEERTYHFDVQDLSLDDMNDDVPRF